MLTLGERAIGFCRPTTGFGKEYWPLNHTSTLSILLVGVFTDFYSVIFSVKQKPDCISDFKPMVTPDAGLNPGLQRAVIGMITDVRVCRPTAGFGKEYWPLNHTSTLSILSVGVLYLL